MKYYVLNTEKFGRAVFAQTDLRAGEVICYCEVLVLSAVDTIKVNQTDLQYYTFTYNHDTAQDCLVLGDGEIFNHDDNANVSYELINLNGRSMMRFATIRDVKANAQLFIDYNADVVYKRENVLDLYKVNMI